MALRYEMCALLGWEWKWSRVVNVWIAYERKVMKGEWGG